jgi:hypothetical protein
MYVVFETVLRKRYLGVVHISSRTLCTERGFKQVILVHFHTHITTYVVMSVYNKAIHCCSRLTSIVDVTQIVSDDCWMRVQVSLNHSNRVPLFSYMSCVVL